MPLKSIKFIQDDLYKIENKLKEQGNKNSGNYHYIHLKEKLFKASLLVLSTKLFKDKVDKKTINLAVALETLNLASLIHDEIIDYESLYARTFQDYKWKNKILILIADYIFSKVITYVLEEVEPFIFQEIFSSLVTRCEGGFSKVKVNSSPDTTEEDYFKVIEKGTSSFTSLCCATGARISKIATEEEIHLLSNYGRNTGIAFQVIEDLLNFKPVEIENITPSKEFSSFTINLPFIYTMGRASKKDKKRLYELFNFNSPEQDKLELKKLFIKYNAIDYSIKKASTYFETAKSQINNFRDCKAKNLLINMGDYIITENFTGFFSETGFLM